jgi:PemK-like, MazF-like toxin of type II toxin-antitoxin system
MSSDERILTYEPHPDGKPDPGEIVWTWVSYEDDPDEGKDRPVLLIGREKGSLLGLMLTTKDHDVDADHEAHWGRYWMDIGAGDWDPRHRQSEVRLDRLLTFDPKSIRREGCRLNRQRFEAVVTAAQEYW